MLSQNYSISKIQGINRFLPGKGCYFLIGANWSKTSSWNNCSSVIREPDKILSIWIIYEIGTTINLNLYEYYHGPYATRRTCVHTTIFLDSKNIAAQVFIQNPPSFIVKLTLLTVVICAWDVSISFWIWIAFPREDLNKEVILNKRRWKGTW